MVDLRMQALASDLSGPDSAAQTLPGKYAYGSRKLY